MADKLRKASSTGVANVTTVATARTTGGTTLAVSTGGLTNWAEDTSVDFSTYTLTGDVITNKCEWTGKANVAGNAITELELTNGTDVGNAVGDIVVCVETAAWVNDLVSTLLTIFDTTGVLLLGAIPGSALANSSVSTIKIADTAVTTAKIPDSAITAIKNALPINDSYSATGVTAAGEYSDVLKKTYDITSIPTDHGFIVSASNFSSSATLANCRCRIVYNGTSYPADVFAQYHITANVTIPLVKVSGQNSVTVYFGGSGASQQQSSQLLQTT